VGSFTTHPFSVFKNIKTMVDIIKEVERDRQMLYTKNDVLDLLNKLKEQLTNN